MRKTRKVQCLLPSWTKFVLSYRWISKVFHLDLMSEQKRNISSISQYTVLNIVEKISTEHTKISETNLKVEVLLCGKRTAVDCAMCEAVGVLARGNGRLLNLREPSYGPFFVANQVRFPNKSTTSRIFINKRCIQTVATSSSAILQ